MHLQLVQPIGKLQETTLQVARKEFQMPKFKMSILNSKNVGAELPLTYACRMN
jgi:hypothetical protein